MRIKNDGETYCSACCTSHRTYRCDDGNCMFRYIMETTNATQFSMVLYSVLGYCRVTWLIVWMEWWDGWEWASQLCAVRMIPFGKGVVCDWILHSLTILDSMIRQKHNHVFPNGFLPTLDLLCINTWVASLFEHFPLSFLNTTNI